MEQLQKLAQQVQRRKKLLRTEQSLKRQIYELDKKVWELKYAWQQEQRDVEKLEKAGLTALFYDLLGKKQERLEKEQQEALAAAAKYRAAQTELDHSHGLLDETQEELRSLLGCEARFEAAKRACAAHLKLADPERGPRILELEKELATVQEQKRELEEALSAGRQALSLARSIQDELGSAEGWGTWDMVSGGGLLTQMAKHNHLDTAQEQVNILQSHLRRFRTELADVQIHTDLQVRVDDFLRFADWFFDGLIVDWTVQEKIREAQDQIYRVTYEIQRLLDRLAAVETSLNRRDDQAREALEELLLAG